MIRAYFIRLSQEIAVVAGYQPTSPLPDPPECDSELTRWFWRHGASIGWAMQKVAMQQGWNWIKLDGTELAPGEARIEDIVLSDEFYRLLEGCGALPPGIREAIAAEFEQLEAVRP